MTTFLEETMREFDFLVVQLNQHDYKSESDKIERIKSFIASRLTLQRKEMREMVERLKVPEGDLMELTGAKMNENSIRHLVRTSCDMRQNVVLEEVLNALGE